MTATKRADPTKSQKPPAVPPETDAKGTPGAAAERLLNIATAPRKNSNRWPQAAPLTWDGLLRWLDLEHPADHRECGGYVAGLFRNQTRDDEHLVSRSVLTLDADEAKPSFLADIARVLPGVAVAVHTTWRHGGESSRYRLLAPLSRDLDGVQYRRLAETVRDALGDHWSPKDNGCPGPVQFMWRPSTQGEYHQHVQPGEPLDVDDWTGQEQEAEKGPAPQAGGPLHPYAAKAIEDELARLDGCELLGWDGPGWNDTTYKVACNLIEFANSPWSGYTLDRAEAELLGRAPTDRDFGPAEHAGCWASALKKVGEKGRGRPGGDDFAAVKVEPTRADAEQHQGHLRMALRMVRRTQDRLRFVHGLGWHVWDGARWAPDRNGTAMRAAVDTVKAAYADLADLPRDEEKALLADIHRCESAGGLEGVLKIAGSLLPLAVSVDQLDADVYMLNTADGTLDLRTGELRPHDPADLLTKVAGCGYDPDATSATFTKFVEEVLPDPDVRAFVGRVFGHALEGRVTEHLLPIFSGTGANGKSTLLEAVSAAFGDYAIAAEPDLLVDRGAVHTTGQADLLGVRLAVCSETDGRSPLAAATVKRLTGGDKIRARKMRRDNIEFAPSHSVVMVTNHRPQVSGDDPALWRRLRVVPFDVVVDKPDTSLGQRLVLELPAILAWVVRGHADWKSHGLAEPSAVAAATASYKDESDDLGRFLEEACTTSPRATVKARPLFDAWKEWCGAYGEDTGTEKAFAKAMTGRGFEKKPRQGSQTYLGLGLLDTTLPGEEFADE